LNSINSKNQLEKQSPFVLQITDINPKISSLAILESGIIQNILENKNDSTKIIAKPFFCKMI
jgi:hypothetical protein